MMAASTERAALSCDLGRQFGEQHLVIWTSKRQTGEIIAPCANAAVFNIRDSS
jgi:hypothetical protein